MKVLYSLTSSILLSLELFIPRPRVRYMFMHPLSIFKKSDSRIESFMAVVEQHKEFFTKCPQIDSYLVGMAFDYLQRTKPSIAPAQYSPNLLFCCLYLAWVRHNILCISRGMHTYNTTGNGRGLNDRCGGDHTLCHRAVSVLQGEQGPSAEEIRSL